MGENKRLVEGRTSMADKQDDQDLTFAERVAQINEYAATHKLEPPEEPPESTTKETKKRSLRKTLEKAKDAVEEVEEQVKVHFSATAQAGESLKKIQASQTWS